MDYVECFHCIVHYNKRVCFTILSIYCVIYCSQSIFYYFFVLFLLFLLFF